MNYPEARPRVLLADDAAVGREVISRLLEQAGFQVTAVSNGQAVLDALIGSSFRLVIMDCMMPVMDGFEAARSIRRGDAGQDHADIPIVALTAMETESSRQKCMDAGMNAYVRKPVEYKVLVAAVQQLLAKRQAGEEQAAAGTRRAEEEALLKSLDDWNPVSMDTIIDQFLEEVPQDIAQLQAGLDQLDLNTLREAAHRLRGSAGVLAARGLADRATALEQAVLENNLPLVRQLAPALIQELENLVRLYEDD